MGNIINAYKILSENLKGKDHFGDRGADGRIILKFILKKQHMGVWTGFIWLRIATSGGLL